MRQSSRVAVSVVLTWLAAFFTLTGTFSLVHVVDAAHSRRRASPTYTASPRYDRSITTFDQSGRLLQVEYGMEASSRGETVMAVWTEGGIYVLVKKTSLQSSHKVHRIDEHLWLFTAGLSGDARALASSLRSSCQQHRLSYGEAQTVEQAARQAASLQHQLTRTGGARPLGCTAIVVGIDPTSVPASTSASTSSGADGNHNSCSRVFRTDPGGILEDCFFSVAGKDQDKLMNEVAKRYDDLKSANQTTVVTELLATLKLAGAGGDKDSSVDIWIFKPNAKRRGKTDATCLVNVKSDDLQDVVSLLEKRENN
jgi:20S proteasome alpha/beta subunit